MGGFYVNFLPTDTLFLIGNYFFTHLHRMAQNIRASRPTRALTLTEKYMMGRKILNAVPTDEIAAAAHCRPADARDLHIALIQLLRTTTIYKLPRTVTFHNTINIRVLPPRGIHAERRSRRWSSPTEIERAERLRITMAPRRLRPRPRRNTNSQT